MGTPLYLMKLFKFPGVNPRPETLSQSGKGSSLGPFARSFTQLGGCQKYGPFLGTLNIRGRIIIGIQQGTTILTTSQLEVFG